MLLHLYASTIGSNACKQVICLSASNKTATILIPYPMHGWPIELYEFSSHCIVISKIDKLFIHTRMCG